jgi:hypothetical protein
MHTKLTFLANYNRQLHRGSALEPSATNLQQNLARKVK